MHSPTTTAGPANCLLCGMPRVLRRQMHAFLCASPHCANRLAAMPASQKCAVCTRPLSASRVPHRVCEQTECQRAWTSDRVRAAAVARREAMHRRATTRRNRAVAQRGIPADARDSYLIAIVPHNTDRPSRLPDERRRAFLARLQANLVDARARLAAEDTPLPKTELRLRENGRTEAEQQAEWDVLGAGCGVCRGNCCRSGGDHAYNNSDTMMWYLLEHPTHDDATIVARYDTLMPATSFTHGCVFQQADGCALPRDLRSDVCNRFFCEYISVLRNQYNPGDPVRAYFVHQRDDELFGGRFVEITVRRDRTP